MFILPPLSYLVCFWRFPSFLGTGMKVACVVMIVFGVATLVVTSVFTIISIVEAFGQVVDKSNSTCAVNYWGNVTNDFI
jgi:uncharacterized membrane protein (DUF485 family)